MKIKRNFPFSPVLLCSCLLLVPQGTNSQLTPLRLEAERNGDQLLLRWQGALGVKLQQNTNLTNAPWVDVPGSDGLSSVQVPMANPMTTFRLLDLRLADDGDGLDDWYETNGWTIFIDAHGYGTGGLVERNVTSDPGLADSDADGLDDFWEWITGSDPRSTDTDGDGLSDYAEWFKWRTSPTSVDTDGDARGPNHNLAPKAQLFDGNELSLLHTSPSLDDTDGDGRSDYEECDQLGRSALVAQLPNLAVELVDAVDIRLDVQYAEEAGISRQYGGELTTSDTTGREDSESSTKSWSVEVGAEYQFTGLWGGLKVSVKGTFGKSRTESFTTSSSHTTQESHSEYMTDSRTRTETTASGSMSGGIRLVNNGPITYKLTDFGLTMRYWAPGGDGADREFKTLATLVPALGANGITLAPGDSTPVLQVQATGLNASRVKEFMARPNSVYLEPAFYELENAEGLNFDFLEEVTRWRTARLEIDYGDGRSEEYRVAANVERNENGAYAGITMDNVMSNILQVPFQTRPIRDFIPTYPSNQRVLSAVRELATTSTTAGFWAVVLSSPSLPQTPTHFEDIVLQAGDGILLTFIRDDDGDGLFAPEEQHYGTTETTTPDGPPPSDSDGDGLTDAFEARTGWDVVLATRSYHVFSDPRQLDQDGDSRSDLQEFQLGTDPAKPDTDDDGITDRFDPVPLVPAKVLRVKADTPVGGNGSSWANALTNLQDALSLARAGDVGEIWVAAGVYKPTITNDRNATFLLVNNTALYGGFSGVETKLSQREPNPLLNGTILSGDLVGNDTSTPWDDPATYNDNSYAVCTAEGYIEAGTVLDGLTITGGNTTTYGGGMVCYGRPQLRNLFFRANTGLNGAGLYVFLQPATPEPYVISDCLFIHNSAPSGGALRASAANPQLIIVTNCHFYENTATGSGSFDQGGGALVVNGMFAIKNCIFSWNSSVKWGGGVTILRASQTPATIVEISRCQFVGNTATSGGAGVYMTDFISTTGDLKVEVLQSVFWGNSSPSGIGPAIAAQGGVSNKRLYVLNSTIVSNVATSVSGAIDMQPARAWIENSILWGNAKGITGAGLITTMRTTCLPDAGSYPGAGNINADPKFVDSFGGNLRLGSGSPCIDRGNNYVDYYPTVPGFQLLPDTDIDGYGFWRVVDGNLDGTSTVDMGAHERQGP